MGGNKRRLGQTELFGKITVAQFGIFSAQGADVVGCHGQAAFVVRVRDAGWRPEHIVTAGACGGVRQVLHQ